jgi:tetratricopeptide (TPR) repeat protein
MLFPAQQDGMNVAANQQEEPLRQLTASPRRNVRSLSPYFGCMALAAAFLFPASLYCQTAGESFESISASAAAARSNGDVGGAIQLYTKAVTLNPQRPDGWWFLGTLQYGADNYLAARDALTHFIDFNQNAGAALALRGLCEFELGQYSESLQDIQHGISLGAANQKRNATILYYHEALLLVRLGRFEEAVSKYGVFVKQGNINDDVTAGLGLAGLRLALFPKDVDPTQVELVTAVGRAAIPMLNGDLPGGKLAFQQLFQRFRQIPNLHYFYGYLVFPTDPDQAVVQFQQELTVAPSSAIAHAMLAWTYGLRGDYSNALPNAQKAAAEDPSLPMSQLVLGRSLVETGDLTGGLSHIEKVLQAEPGNLEAHITAAKAYSKLGQKEDARRERMLCLELAGQGASPSANP